MIQLSNSVAQAIQPGQAVTFDVVDLHTGCGECFNKLVPTSVKLRFNGGVYKLQFTGNATTDPAATAQLAIAIGGTPLVNTAMNLTPATAGELINVHAETLFKNDCCGDVDRVSVINTGTVAVTLAPGSSFSVVRKS